MKSNIVYQTDQIARYFAKHRVTWDQFYKSEQIIIDQLGLTHHQVLDIGCGCGGLGLVLRDRFGISSYTGVEINRLAAQAARVMNPTARILCGDILDLSQNALFEESFEVVFSLSCIDWNIRFSDMLAVAWSHVRPGGHFVATFRLTVGQGCDNVIHSYQYINFEGIRQGEVASYVVLNAKTLIQQLVSFNPSEINAYGYWGVPSATAVTPYERLCFAAFSVRKRANDDKGALRCRLELPEEIQRIAGLTQ